MQEALQELVEVSGIDLVYRSELVADRRVFCSIKQETPERILQCILKESGLDYIQSSTGTYVIIESLEESPLFGNLAGRITDLDTGAPLPYANVLLADASSGATTDDDGLFRFSSLISGTHQLVVTYVGYETTVDTVWIGPGQNNTQIRLRSRDVSVGPIVIDGLEQRLPSSGLGTGSLAREQLSRLSASGTSDAIQEAGRIAGVGIQQPLAALHIQGSAGNEHVTLLDGAPVRNPVSMGRHLGAFSPLAIKRLTVHKAGYGAQHGSNLTGYVAVDHDVAPANAFEGALMLDPVSTNIRLQSRFAENDDRGGSLLAAYRTSNWDVYQDRGVQTLLRHWNAIDPLLGTLWIGQTVNQSTFNRHIQQPEVSFNDLHLAGRFNPGAFHNVHASLYRASNRLASDLAAYNQPDLLESGLFILTRDRYSWLNWASQIRHSWLIDARMVLNTQLKGSWHDSGYSYKGLNDSIESAPTPDLLDRAVESYQDALEVRRGSAEQNKIREYTLTSALSYSISANHHAELGLETSVASSRFFFRHARVDTIDYNLDTAFFAGYLHDRIALNAYAVLEPGIRVTYAPLRKTVYAEPRIALRLDGNLNPLGAYAFRLAGGVYRQFVNQFELTSLGPTSAVPSILFWLPVDRSLAPPRAFHLTAETLLNLTQSWSINLEAYAKWMPRMLAVDYARLQETPLHRNPSRQDRFITATRGRAYGFSVQIQRKRDRISYNVLYGFNRSLQRYPDRFDDAILPSPWNVPHRISFDATALLTGLLSMEVNWISEWGRSWAYRRAYYDFFGFGNSSFSVFPFELGTPSNDKLPGYRRLDVGLTYTLQLRRFKSPLRLFVINVLDRQNVFDQSFEPGESGLILAPRTLPGPADFSFCDD